MLCAFMFMFMVKLMLILILVLMLMLMMCVVASGKTRPTQFEEEVARGRGHRDEKKYLKNKKKKCQEEGLSRRSVQWLLLLDKQNNKLPTLKKTQEGENLKRRLYRNKE